MPLNFLNTGYFAGTVGIGTNSPSANLEIESASNPEISIASTAGATSNYLNFKATSHTQPIQSQIKTVDNNDFTADLAFLFKGTGTGGTLSECMRIEAGGNVGIGEISPSSKLDVVGANSGSIPLVELTASGTGTFQRGVRLLNGGMNVGDSIMYAIGYADNSKNMGQTYFYYAGSGSTSNRISIGLHGVNDVLNVLGTGNVGIGETNPVSELHISGSKEGNVALAVQNTNSSYSSQVRFLNSVGTEMSAITFVPSDNSLRFYNNGNDKMIISSAGAMQFNAYGAGVLVTDASGNITATTSPPVDGITFNNGATITNQINTDVDTGTETIASVATATHDSAFFDFVIKKGLNVRSGTVYACHDGDTTPLVAFTETSTQDLGDTSDVTLSVDISGGNMRLRATTTSDDWSVKSLIRAI